MFGRQRSCRRNQNIIECVENGSRSGIPARELHLSRALHLVSLCILFVVNLGFIVVLTTLAGVVSGGVCVVGPKRKIHTVNRFGLGKTLEATWRKPPRRKPVFESGARLLLRDTKRQDAAGRQYRIG